jgi:ribosomal protein S18 acetylase RimI-like enzyme
VHRFLSEESYWCPGVSREVVERSIENSLCFGAYDGDEQIGFARVVTDCATFAHLLDVFVLSEHRGRGVGKELLRAVISHPGLQGLRKITLHTEDAHSLYEQFGFRRAERLDSLMEL